MDWLIVNVRRLQQWLALIAVQHRTIGALLQLVLGAAIGIAALSMVPANAPFFSVVLCVSAGAFSMLFRWRPRQPFQMAHYPDRPWPSARYERRDPFDERE